MMIKIYDVNLMINSKLNKFDTVRDYLTYIGSDREYKLSEKNCELCNSDSFTTLRAYTDAGNDNLVPLSVKACDKCGFIMQNPRFSREFYKRFYSEFYPQSRVRSKSNDPNDPKSLGGKRVVSDDGRPTEEHYQSAFKRADSLYTYIKNKGFKIPKNTFLDVGCGCGAFLEFLKKKVLRLLAMIQNHYLLNLQCQRISIDCIPGEEMSYENEKFGLIIIMGSLEHVHDPNIILEKCWDYLVEDGLLVLQGRYYPVSESFRWLNANHHRFLTHETIQAIAIKHGFNVLESTDYSVCGKGTGRKGNGFLFARKNKQNKKFINKNLSQDLLEELKIKSLVKTPREIIDLLIDMMMLKV